MTETAEKWTSFPITYKNIDVSTTHITKMDDEILLFCMKDKDDGDHNEDSKLRSAYRGCAPYDKAIRTDITSDVAPAGYAYDQVYWVWIGLGAVWATEARREGSKFSESFINLYERAVHSDADWMKLDCDGMIYDDLPKYVW